MRCGIGFRARVPVVPPGATDAFGPLEDDVVDTDPLQFDGDDDAGEAGTDDRDTGWGCSRHEGAFPI